MLRIDQVPQNRGSCHQERRGARRHRRDRRDGGAAGAAQRDLCRDRRRAAAAADRPLPDRGGEKIMSAARAAFCFGVVAIAVVVVAGGPLDRPRSRPDGLRRRPEGGAGGLQGRRSHRRPGFARQGEPGRTRRISGAGGRLRGLPHHPGRQGICRRPRASSCRSARCIRPTSRRTRKPASAITAIRISSTRCIAASAATARGFIRRCRITSYTYMTDADALAIKAYLFSLPPVRAPAPGIRWCFRSTSAGR